MSMSKSMSYTGSNIWRWLTASIPLTSPCHHAVMRESAHRWRMHPPRQERNLWWYTVIRVFFNINEGQGWILGTEDQSFIQSKTKGIMVNEWFHYLTGWISSTILRGMRVGNTCTTNITDIFGVCGEQGRLLDKRKAYCQCVDTVQLPNSNIPANTVAIWSELLSLCLWRRCFECQEDESPSRWSIATYEGHNLGWESAEDGEWQWCPKRNEKSFRREGQQHSSDECRWYEGCVGQLETFSGGESRDILAEPWLSGFIHSKVLLWAESHRVCVGSGPRSTLVSLQISLWVISERFLTLPWTLLQLLQ